MSTPYDAPGSGSSAVGGGGPAPGGGRYQSVGDAIPDAEPLEGSHQTYAKGEVGSIGGLVSDISNDLSTLMRQEVALAKAELKQSATKAGKGAGMLAGAGYAGHMVALFLSIALWWALSHLVGHSWSALIVAILWGIIGAVAFTMGKKKFQQVNPKPERTVETLQQVPGALKPN